MKGVSIPPLQEDPGQPDANQNLGLVEVEEGGEVEWGEEVQILERGEEEEEEDGPPDLTYFPHLSPNR